MTIKLYIYFILIGIDQLLNTIFMGAPDETISARCYRNRDKVVWNTLMSILNLIFYPFDGDNHCQQAYENELKRLQLPDEYRMNR